MNLHFVSALARLDDPAEVAGVLHGAYPAIGYIRPLVDWAFSDRAGSFDDPELTATDRLFITAIEQHKAYASARQPVLDVIEIGREFDPVGRTDLIDTWSICKLVCYLVAQKTRPTRRCAAVVGMRDEGATAVEWIAHYQAIGVDRIFVYTNGNTDGTDRILECLARHGEIVLLKNDIGPDVYPQFKIYEHFLIMLAQAREYEWCCFFDSDELFVPSEAFGHNVNSMLDHVDSATPGAGAVWFPWRWVVSDMCFKREPGLLSDRFHHAYKHGLVKSIARMGAIMGMKPLHSPYLRDDVFPVDAAPAKRTMEELFTVVDWPETSGMLHHYWCKSFEEFYLKKRRGDTIQLQDNAYQRDLQLFFQWNGSTAVLPDCRFPLAMRTALAGQWQRLMSLDGVAEAVDAADAAFRGLVETDSAGIPLLRLYETLRNSPAPGLA